MRFSAAVFATFVFAACASKPPPDDEPDAPQLEPGLALSEASFADIPGWGAGGEAAALRAFRRTCPRFERMSRRDKVGPRYAGEARFWQDACAASTMVPAAEDLAARTFFEARFTPIRLTPEDHSDNARRTTSYFEPELDVAWSKDGDFTEPILARPANLVDVEAPSHGYSGGMIKEVFQRASDGTLLLAPARGAYRRGGEEAIAFGRTADVVFLQIQGSGRIKFPDGAVWRASFDGSNGRTYSSLGGELIRRGYMTRDTASADAIRAWMDRAPEAELSEVINANERYIFFRLEEIADPTIGPRGAANVPLEAGASIAIDPRWHAYGLMFFVAPLGDNAPAPRLAVAQDTGAAITGPLRSDIFWGTGAVAGYEAGRVNHVADWWALVPNEVVDELRSEGALP